MKKKFASIILLCIVCWTPTHLVAQTQQPFTFTLHGGLFFPSKSDFHDLYKSNSDLIWSAGIALPVTAGLFITADAAWFKAEGFFTSSGDSTARYEERIMHAGLLNKQPLSPYLQIRLMGGINKVKVSQFFASQQTTEQSIETGTINGYYGGIGIEQDFDDPHTSLFADVIYDYSRSQQKDFPGDLGGIRFVIGANLILF